MPALKRPSSALRAKPALASAKRSSASRVQVATVNAGDERFIAVWGDTYNHRDFFKTNGASWHSPTRSWRFAVGKKALVERLLRLNEIPEAGSAQTVDLPGTRQDGTDLVKVRVLEEMIGLVVVLEGKTFQFKHEIKEAGGFWCKTGRCWMFGPNHFSQARRLLGLKKLPRDHGWETCVDMGAAIAAARVEAGHTESLNVATVTSMTVAELELALRARGKSTRGRKPELAARLLRTVHAH